MSRDRLLTLLAVVLGIALLALAVIYLAEPARSLPAWLPGYEAGSGRHHVTHAIAAAAAGAALLVYAWFRTSPNAARAAGR